MRATIIFLMCVSISESGKLWNKPCSRSNMQRCEPNLHDPEYYKNILNKALMAVNEIFNIEHIDECCLLDMKSSKGEIVTEYVFKFTDSDPRESVLKKCTAKFDIADNILYPRDYPNINVVCRV